MKNMRNILLIVTLIQVGCSGFVMNDKIIGNYSLVAVDNEEQSCLCYFDSRDNNDGCIPIIASTVFSVGFSSQYIIAKQHPNGNKNIVNYFILNIRGNHFPKDKDVIGPLTEDQFNSKRIEIGIPKYLNFTIDRSNEN